MSWEIFKQNVLRVANNPQSINDIDIVAKTYATEYDAAVKRGGDTVNSVPVKTGNLPVMEQIFKSALQKGLSSTEPYDLVGEMGKGVVAYWTGATLNEFPIPVIPAVGAANNIGVVTNIVINPGTWAPVSVNAAAEFQLTPEEKLDYENRLQIEISKYEIEVTTSPTDILEAREDTISKFTGILENNENYRVDIPVPFPILTADTKSVDINGNEVNINTTATATNTGENEEEDNSELEFGDDVGPPPPRPKIKLVIYPPQSNNSYPTGVYQQSTPYFSAGASVAEKAVAIALTDIKDGVIEIPDSSNTGHPRLLQIQRTAARSEWTEFPWCASAVFTWWYEAGFPFATDKNDPTYLVNPKHCVSWQQWAVKTGRWVDKRNGANPNFIPKAGDAVMYSTDNATFDHIGMVYELKDGKLTSIDGNYKNSVSYNLAYTKYVAGYVQI